MQTEKTDICAKDTRFASCSSVRFRQVGRMIMAVWDRIDNNAEGAFGRTHFYALSACWAKREAGEGRGTMEL